VPVPIESVGTGVYVVAPRHGDDAGLEGAFLLARAVLAAPTPDK